LAITEVGFFHTPDAIPVAQPKMSNHRKINSG